MIATPLPAAAITAAAEATRNFLRSAGTAEQALIERVAASAILLGEAYAGTTFLARAMEDVLPARTDWTPLAAVPVRTIAGLTALPTAAAPAAIPADGYATDIDDEARGWVRLTAPAAAPRVAVSYTAGLADDWNALPEPLAQGVVMLAAHLFEDRGTDRSPPAAVAALWRPYRRMRLAEMRA